MLILSVDVITGLGSIIDFIVANKCAAGVGDIVQEMGDLFLPVPVGADRRQGSETSNQQYRNTCLLHSGYPSRSLK